MTTTLPASQVPGLLRNGSPVSLTSAIWIHATGVIRETDGKLYSCMVVETGGSFLPALVKDSDPYELVLDDPTGFGHALLYLATKLTIPATGGPSWTRVDASWRDRDYVPKHYILRAQGEKHAEDAVVFFCEDAQDAKNINYLNSGALDYDRDIVVVPGIVGAESNAEALRLAVLKVAGVQS